MNNKYILELDEIQLNDILISLESYMRFQIGQADFLLHRITDLDGKYVYENNEIESIENNLKSKLHLTKSGSYGITNKKETSRMYDTLQVIRNKLSWDRAKKNNLTDGKYRDWKTMITVDFDNPLQTNLENDLPIIKNKKQ